MSEQGADMTVMEAQSDLRRAFVGGGPGIFISALIWFAAALVENARGIAPAFAVLFFGGMAIFPLAMVSSRFLFRREKASTNNPLGLVALESTIAMLGGLFAAWLFLPFEPAYVFPVAAIAVGTHYAVFKTVYGNSLFWMLGALVTSVGFIDIFGVLRIPGGVIFAVAGIEMLFAIILTIQSNRTSI